MEVEEVEETHQKTMSNSWSLEDNRSLVITLVTTTTMASKKVLADVPDLSVYGIGVSNNHILY